MTDITGDFSSTDDVDSSSSNLLSGTSATAQAVDNDLGDHLDPFTLGCQTRQSTDTVGVQEKSAPSTAKNSEEKILGEENDYSQCMNSLDPVCHVKLESLIKLKHSTKQLLCLVEEIQSKTVNKNSVRNNSNQFCLSDLITAGSSSNVFSSVVDLTCANAIKKLEAQTKALEAISDLGVEEDDCSVYKRLTRKCHCLNRSEYNDFMIHFNEGTRYFTSTLGEIIKNIRIVKKFLLMGGNYTKNALTFLTEGLSKSSHFEKVDIIQGCAHADVCSVFDEHSIVIACIIGSSIDIPTDINVQIQTASFLHMLSQLEEGRRYLNFSSKITNDIKKVLKKKLAKVDNNTLEFLNSTLNLLHPPLSEYANVTYYCKPVDEGYGGKALTALIHSREHMTLEEVFYHLDLIQKSSNNDNGKREIISVLPTLLKLFTCMLQEYDNSKMNIVITNILNNVISRNMLSQPEFPKTVVMAETATEPIEMKHESNQIPFKKNMKKPVNKSRLRFSSPSSKFRQQSKIKGEAWDSAFRKPKTILEAAKNTHKFSVILVPIEKNKKSFMEAV